MIDQLPDELKCCRRTLQKDLKDLDVMRKRLRRVPYERNSLNTIRERRKYCMMIEPKDDSLLYFLDETSVNLHTAVNYGYV